MWGFSKAKNHKFSRMEKMIEKFIIKMVLKIINVQQCKEMPKQHLNKKNCVVDEQQVTQKRAGASLYSCDVRKN